MWYYSLKLKLVREFRRHLLELVGEIISYFRQLHIPMQLKHSHYLYFRIYKISFSLQKYVFFRHKKQKYRPHLSLEHCLKYFLTSRVEQLWQV